MSQETRFSALTPSAVLNLVLEELQDTQRGAMTNAELAIRLIQKYQSQLQTDESTTDTEKPASSILPEQNHSLSDYTDAQIAWEHHHRMLKILGNPWESVTMTAR